MEPKKTPLYDMHVRAGAKMVDFHGWLMPLQFASILAEHAAVRESAGLFDISHMGVLDIAGPGASKLADYVLANDIKTLKTGRARYSPMCNEKGGTVDDVLAYKLSDAFLRLVVNAANTGKDLAWIAAHNREQAEVIYRSDGFAIIALQGPRSSEVLRAADAEARLPTRAYSFLPETRLAGVGCMLARTGYTGEIGYEIFCAPRDAQGLWEALLEAGKAAGARPCGLGARDSLRLEAGMPLYGNELNEDISPLEAGLHAFVDMDDPGFVGAEALMQPVRRRRVGFVVDGREIPRAGYKVLDSDGCAIGRVTSGGYSPTLDTGLGMALVPNAWADGKLLIRIRDRQVPAHTVPLPFYRRKQIIRGNAHGDA